MTRYAYIIVPPASDQRAVEQRAAASDALRDRGYTPLNPNGTPVPLGTPFHEGASWEGTLWAQDARARIHAMTCPSVTVAYVCEGWEHSRMAAAELATAHTLRYTIYYAPNTVRYAPQRGRAK